jgi:hypothetical protein
MERAEVVDRLCETLADAATLAVFIGADPVQILNDVQTIKQANPGVYWWC